MKIHSLLLLMLFYSGVVFAQSTPTKYFEGIVEYEIKAQSYMQGVSDNEVRERIGTTLRFYFKNGNYVREYIDGAGYTLKKMIYRTDKKLMYYHNGMASPDTLYFNDPAEVAGTYTIEPGKPETILNHDCSSSVITAKIYFPPMGDTMMVLMSYYFSPDMPVDPEWTKDMYIWKDVINQHKSIAIKFVEDMPVLFKQTFTATKILWQPVPDETFKIDPKLVLVKEPTF